MITLNLLSTIKDEYLQKIISRIIDEKKMRRKARVQTDATNGITHRVFQLSKDDLCLILPIGRGNLILGPLIFHNLFMMQPSTRSSSKTRSADFLMTFKN